MYNLNNLISVNFLLVFSKSVDKKTHLLAVTAEQGADSSVAGGPMDLTAAAKWPTIYQAETNVSQLKHFITNTN